MQTIARLRRAAESAVSRLLGGPTVHGDPEASFRELVENFDYYLAVDATIHFEAVERSPGHRKLTREVDVSEVDANLDIQPKASLPGFTHDAVVGLDGKSFGEAVESDSLAVVLSVDDRKGLAVKQPSGRWRITRFEVVDHAAR